MPASLNRGYARRVNAVGITEKVLGLAILVLTAGIVATFIAQTMTTTDSPAEVDVDTQAASEGTPGTMTAHPQPAEGSDASVVAPEVSKPTTGQSEYTFPDPDLDGWQAPGRVLHYTPGNLHKKINGRAEIYLHYGVTGLTFGTYRHRVEAGHYVDVYWYHMGEPGNALAVYRAESPPDMPPIAIGDRAYRAGSAVFLQSGAHYVQVLPGSLDDVDAAAAERVARRLAEQIGRGSEHLRDKPLVVGRP